MGKPEVLMLGFVCALVGSSFWVLFASRHGWPVSTTHSIVGAIIGVGIAAFGSGVVDWTWVCLFGHFNRLVLARLWLLGSLAPLLLGLLPVLFS